MSTWSGVWTFTTILSTPVLASPTNASGNVSISPTLSWNSVNTAVSYHLNVSVVSDFSTTVYDLSGLTGTAQPLTGLANFTTYYWEVGAKDGSGLVSDWSGAWSFTTIVAAPGAPQLALPTNGATGEPVALNLSWNSVNTAVSYHLVVSAGTDFTTTIFSQGSLTGTTQALNGLLANSTAYIWRVGAKNVGGMSGWSGVWTFTTILSTPVLASPINASGNVSISPTLSWNSVNTAVSYHLNVSVVSDFSTTVYDLSGLTGTAQPLTGLANSTTYYWEVGAKDGSGLVSGWSLTRSFTTIIAAPGAPQLALPTNGATGEPVALNLSWNSVNTAVSYHLTVSAGTDFTTTIFSQGSLTGTAQALSGLLANSTAYIWRVGAKDIGGVSTWSGVWTFTTILSTPVLASPINASGNVSIAPTLSWNSVNTAVSYHLNVSVVSDFSTTVYDLSGLTGTAQPLTGLANSTTYYWEVGAKDGSGLVSGWSGAWSFTTIVAAPGAPQLALPTNGATGEPVSLNLSWNSVSTAVSYHLTVSAGTDFTTTVFSQGSLTGTSQALSGLLANSTAYIWRVGAKDIGGVSTWSGVWTFTTVIAPPGAPQLALPTNGATGEPVNLSLSWNSVNTAVSYHLDVSAGTDFTTTVFSQGGLTGTSQALSGLANVPPISGGGGEKCRRGERLVGCLDLYDGHRAPGAPHACTADEWCNRRTGQPESLLEQVAWAVLVPSRCFGGHRFYDDGVQPGRPDGNIAGVKWACQLHRLLSGGWGRKMPKG